MSGLGDRVDPITGSMRVQLMVDLDTLVFDNEVVPASAGIVSGAIDVREDISKTVFIKTTKNANLHVQLSDDETADPDKRWHDLCDATGAAITFTCNNTAKAIPISVKAIWMRLVVDNTDASNENTVYCGVV